MTLLDQIRPRLARLAPPGTRLVVGVSGGPDSQVLLDLVGRLRRELEWDAVWAVGVDHGLRPEAPGELALAQALARQHDIRFAAVAVDVARRGNLPAQARKARYHALRQFLRQHNGNRLAVAHTRTDQAETVLLHLLRGAATRGARGMPWRRGPLIRPLLGTTRDEVLAYLATRGIASAQDPSNADLSRARPVLRHQVLPLLRQLNPGVERALARHAALAAADELLLTELARAELGRRQTPDGSLELTDFDQLPQPIASRAVRLWAAAHRLPMNQTRLSRWLAGMARRRLRETLAGATVSLERERLWCERPDAQGIDQPLPSNATVPLGPWTAKLHSRLWERLPGAPMRPRSPDNTAVEVDFDFDSLHLGIRVRRWRRGDRIRPFRLAGHVKVGDLFTDAKIPRALRATWPLVVHGEEVLWVVGLRRSNTAPLSADTRRVLSLALDGALPWRPC